MSAEEFINALHAAVYKTAIEAVMKQLGNPAGRRPRSDLVELSAWFNDLTEGDREQVKKIVGHSVCQAIFNFLAALDGVKVIDEKHQYYLRTGEGELLNEMGDLHELFQIRVDHELGYVDEFGNPLT